jgi:LPP20 lipoprotein
MSKITSALLVSAVVLAISACSSTPPAPPKSMAECVFPGTDKAAPLWVCDAPVEGMAVGAVGSAQKSDAGVGFMKQMAATDARVQLAQNMKVQVQNMIKQYVETTGAADKETVDKVNTSVTKQITDQTLQGTKIFRSIVAPDGTMYVLVGLDDVSVQKLTESAIKTSMSNDQAAWQQFRAQKGQEELAAEIAKQKVEFDKSKAPAPQ